MTNEEAIKALKRIRDEAINNFVGDWQDYEAFDIALKALANHKTEPNSSENPNNCETCYYEPQTEPQNV